MIPKHALRACLTRTACRLIARHSFGLRVIDVPHEANEA